MRKHALYLQNFPRWKLVKNRLQLREKNVLRKWSAKSILYDSKTNMPIKNQHFVAHANLCKMYKFVNY